MNIVNIEKTFLDRPTILPAARMLPRGGFTAFAAFTIFTVSAASAALPSFDQVRFGFQSTEGVLLDRNGQPIQEMRVEERGRRLDWVPLEEVSPAALEAIVRAEDKRFYHHRGVDWIALSDAALDTLFAHPRGA